MTPAAPVVQIQPQTVQPAADVASPAPVVPSVVAGYPGPAFRLTSDLRVAEANAAAQELLDGDPRWLPDVLGWLTTASVAPGLRSVPVVVPRGGMVVEWAAIPLGGEGTLLVGRDATLERQLRHTLTESRRRYKDLVEVSSDFAWETGPEGHFVFVTTKGALGYGPEALIGRDPHELAVEEWEDMPLPFDARRPVDQAEFWLKRADGTPACVVGSALPLYDAQGRWAGARGVCRDVTDAVTRASELARVRNREKLLAHIVHTLRNRLDAAEALAVAAAETARALGAEGCRIFRTGEDGQMSLVVDVGGEGAPDEVAATALPPLLSQAAATDDPVLGILGATRVLAARTEYQQAVNGAVLVWRGDYADPWDDEDRQLIGGVADQLGIAHAHWAYQERLRRLSERDGLTGLFNRRTFFERMEEQLATRETGPSALLYVDLDNFKAVNDLHGHQQGDLVLKAIGKLLTNGVRPGDLPGRLGGDEFVLWLGRTDEERARTVAERLLLGVRNLSHLSASPDKPLGLSIGIAVHRPSAGETVQELTDRADSAMYAAKGRGKGNFAFAPPHVAVPPAAPTAETAP